MRKNCYINTKSQPLVSILQLRGTDKREVILCGLGSFAAFSSIGIVTFILPHRQAFGDSECNMADYENFLTGCFPSIDSEIVSYVGGCILIVFLTTSITHFYIKLCLVICLSHFSRFISFLFCALRNLYLFLVDSGFLVDSWRNNKIRIDVCVLFL